MEVWFWCLVLLSMSRVHEGSMDDLVKGLPGQPKVGFEHYAGYVNVGGQKALFYWFFEAETEPEKKPLLLWLNGGPGCSSVAYGAAQELGPFFIRSNSTNLTFNPYSWNKVVNLLFLEAPVGVGFSYTNKTNDLRELGDKQTAKDSYDFLQNWFKKFPKFKSHEFFIAGESYAGHYVPQLAELIYERNKGASKESRINFKGFMIGNAVLNDQTDQLGMFEYAWNHAIISYQLHSAVRKDCDSFKEEAGGKPPNGCSPAVCTFLVAYDDIDIYSILAYLVGLFGRSFNTAFPVKIGNAVLNDQTDQLGMLEYAWTHAIISDQLHSAVRKECDSFKEEESGGKPTNGCSPAVRAFLSAYDDIDIYSIYTPVCLSSLESELKSDGYVVRAPRLLANHGFWRNKMWSKPAGYDPCTEDYVKTYFNRAEVQKALHANRTHIPYPYSPCSEVIQKWKDSPSTILPILKKLMKAGLRIWVYSGDTDGRVPVTSTRYSINAMKLNPKKENNKKNENNKWGGWRAWYYKEQVAGWLVEYEEGLVLATVRGAGHQVPAFAPDRSLSLISHFVEGKELPSRRFR